MNIQDPCPLCGVLDGHTPECIVESIEMNAELRYRENLKSDLAAGIPLSFLLGIE